MSLGLSTVNENARSALDCGGSTPPWNNAKEEEQGGVEPPQSKVPSAHSFSGQQAAEPSATACLMRNKKIAQSSARY
ncbi:MAG TPA: hypothetical protein VKO18_22105 [Terriglobia bacterium]|nr:hypothetical protein [Terriglobia bacterium]